MYRAAETSLRMRRPSHAGRRARWSGVQLAGDVALAQRTICAVAGRAERCTALFVGPGGAYAQSAAPDPGSCTVNIAGAVRDPDFQRL